MKDLLADRERVTHDVDVVQEQLDTFNTLPELTKRRILVNAFPYSAIDYNAEDNYRKTGVDPDGDKIRELGLGIQDTGLQQPIALISHTLSGHDLQALAAKGQDVLRDAALWQDKLSVIFGNRRYLAITHHTDFTHEAAFVYPKEALSWVKTIALIENLDREDPDIHEQAIGVYQVVQNRFGGVVYKFAKQSGQSNDEINRYYKIGEACSTNDYFRDLVKSNRTNDRVALSDIAKSIVSAKTPVRSENIAKQIQSIMDSEIKNLRQYALQMKNYAKGKTRKLDPVQASDESNSDAVNEESANTKPEPKPAKVTSKQIKRQVDNLILKLDTFGSEELDDETRARIDELHSVLGRF